MIKIKWNVINKQVGGWVKGKALKVYSRLMRDGGNQKVRIER